MTDHVTTGLIDRALYEGALLRLTLDGRPNTGGQDLLMAEIVGCFAGCHTIWLPFARCGALAKTLARVGLKTVHDPHWDQWPNAVREMGCRSHVDGVYYGTPTIVEGAALFPESLGDCRTGWTHDESLVHWRSRESYVQWWNAQRERAVVRMLSAVVERVAHERLRTIRIVSGLGSGDVTLSERMHDMGVGTAVAAVKHFRDGMSTFSDYVLVRDCAGTPLDSPAPEAQTSA